ncbi:hypothetical protein B0H17DRAFT_1144698 [Mycena rosella]|uniref:Uncharacterized protein n=1 Tax=Mycena rosella TaxID=1033263 RepID=A0AAD7G5G0_MYCRO|nr:hypothetical protein B0H17DRAFT_1144698 [Mycena rosella]
MTCEEVVARNNHGSKNYSVTGRNRCSMKDLTMQAEMPTQRARRQQQAITADRKMMVLQPEICAGGAGRKEQAAARDSCGLKRIEGAGRNNCGARERKEQAGTG